MVQSAIHSYLTFMVGQKNLALNIRNVREVMDLPRITRVPRLPSFIVGVINLRGKVVPVIDIARKLMGRPAALSPAALSPAALSNDACIIILESTLNEEKVLVGAIVDSVQDVLGIHDTAMSQAPRLGTGIRNDLILTMANHHDQFIMIVNIDKILSEDHIFTFLPMKETIKIEESVSG